VSKLVVIAVLVLAAVATADAFKPAPRERTPASPAEPAQDVVVHRASSGLVAVGSFTRKRVLRNGREYLSAEQVDGAFPAALQGVPFDIAYVARAADGTVALGVYKFPPAGPVRAAIELWRQEKLVNAFPLRQGILGGGLGFADDGRYVAALSPDGLLVHLFARNGRPAGTATATSW
jgi:hypothetical protein